MKNRYYVTVTDLKGMKTFSFDKIIKVYIITTIVGVLLSLGIISAVAIALNKKVKQYSYYRVENEKLVKEVTGYEAIIKEKSDEMEQKNLDLENLNTKIKEIEELVGEDSVLNEDLSKTEKLDVAKINLMEKKLLLSVIPSGRPVVPFNGYSSRYGMRMHPVLKKKAFHKGLDFKAPVGTKLIAAADGIVEFAGWNSGGFGNLVIISHAYGFKTYYAHMSKINVKVGDILVKGEKLGLSGATGRVSGPHLHYEVLYLGKRVNPISFTEWSLNNYEYLFNHEKGVKWQSLVRLIKGQIKDFTNK